MKLPKYLFIGSDLNLTAFSRFVIDGWKKKGCWNLYASGKASIGRRQSVQAVINTLQSLGFTPDQASQFVSDCKVVMRAEQRAEE